MIYTFEAYCADLDYFNRIEDIGMLSEGIVDVLSGVRGKLGQFILDAKNVFNEIIKDTKISTKQLIQAFKDKDFFAILKHFGFSIKTMLKNLHKVMGLINGGFLSVIKGIHENSKLLKKLHKGGQYLDDFLAKHPILKKLTGPVVAAMLLYTWLNMTFVGSFDYDMDISDMFSALGGSYSVSDLFTSPQGVLMITFLSTGLLSGGVLSVAWLGSTAGNLTAAITYVLLKKTRADRKILNTIKTKYIRSK